MKNFIFIFIIATLSITGLSVKASTVQPQHTTFSAGEYRSVFITENGDLYLLGDNSYDIFPQKPGHTSAKKIMEKTVSADAGYNYSLAITEDGGLYTWGSNSCGQLGDGTYEDRNTPCKIMDNILTASAGNSFGMALTKDRELYTWGDNYFGQLGNNGALENSASPIKIMDNVTAISAGRDHAMAITADGSLYTWGYNVINRSESSLNIYSPLKIMNHTALISAGYHNSMAVTKDGALYVWGCNFYGTLGNGSHSLQLQEPEKVMDRVIAISNGYDHCMAVTADYNLYTWGLGPNGDGLNNPCYTPKKIMSNVAAIEAGYRFDLAATLDGTLYAWGENQHGQLGNGTANSQYTPKSVRYADKILLNPPNQPSDWAQDEIDAATENGLIPNALNAYYQNPITRHDFCLLVKQVFNNALFINKASNEETNPNVQFSDTTDASVLYAARLGIVNGYEDGSFRPNATITRQEAAVILYRMEQKLAQNPLPAAPNAPFTDIADWAVPAVNYMVSHGIMNGTGNGFDPEGTYTTEQAIVTIQRLFEGYLF